jgi:hypothetical protein
MKKLILFFGGVASLLAIAGCKKILEVAPKSQITEQVYFKNEGDFEPYVTGIYTYMRTLANNVTYGEERSEELVAASNARFSTAWNQILSPSVGAINYSYWYQAIGQCNLLLAKIKPFAFASDPDTKSRIVAETHALRAYFYFHLMRIIGDCPLMLQAVTSADVPLLQRAPAADVMKQVLGDLDTAINTFPEKDFVSKYRFSYPAAEALRAEASLWNAKVLGAGEIAFNDALDAAAEVEKANVSLLPDFRDVTTVRQNNEVILAAYYQRDETGNNYAVNSLPFLSIVKAASNLDSIPWCQTSSHGQGAYQISPLSKSLFTDPNDKRIPSTWILERDGNTTSFSWITKYPGNVYPDDRVPDNDLIIFRLADVYLMSAEAFAGLGNTDSAVVYLNKVRQRAGIGDYTGPSDKSSVEREILDERGRELFFENKRWYDLVRFYKGGTIDIYNYIPNLEGKSTPIYWPLSSSVLANNSKITQTQGY